MVSSDRGLKFSARSAENRIKVQESIETSCSEPRAAVRFVRRLVLSPYIVLEEILIFVADRMSQVRPSRLTDML